MTHPAVPTGATVKHDIELTPNWTPLECRLPPVLCAEFMWMFRQAGVEHYKHRDTRRYLLLGQGGECVARTDGGFEEVDFEKEWQRVSGRRKGEADGQRE
jgi:hypothetical protein